ncbi:MAG TPA: DNA mismatch repair endonuclease MutL [Lachnospiraceae bacterium]|nr:DNA mismatch repair endonuclease MutL [Lachnospiraceae bacterium]
MSEKQITVLDDKTIDKIAAGEVVERPSSVVKELLENAIDAGADAITVEIKNGGINFIRVTDNGEGIDKSQVPTAFLRHATSKIKSVEDLFLIKSLGFRGEALSSIAAVGQVEMITKTKDALTGVRYVIEGTKERIFEDVGAPEGTTFVIRSLFFNTPARRKFLKTPTTEASYITELMERVAMSHPNISFKFINNGQVKLQTSGNGQAKDIIYRIYGRDVTDKLLVINEKIEHIKVSGFVGKPDIGRSNRGFEHYFVNGRYIKSNLITKALEEAYKPYLMQHKYPFVVLYFKISPDLIDVNVHPNKMELRFMESDQLYDFIIESVRRALSQHEMIPVDVRTESTKRETPVYYHPDAPEPFERQRIKKESSIANEVNEAFNYTTETVDLRDVMQNPILSKVLLEPKAEEIEPAPTGNIIKANEQIIVERASQMELFEEQFLSQEAVKEHKILGQLFDTYWLVAFSDKLFVIDQHAAHEKVIYEKMIKHLEEKECVKQILSPPIIISVSKHEAGLLETYMEEFLRLGFEIEEFGGNEYSIRAVPADLYGMQEQEMFREILDSLSEELPKGDDTAVLQKIASASCKSAVKGNHAMSEEEAKALIDELLQLDNPYHCPHGRPTIIAFTKYEIEKKFKRII